MSPFFNCTYPVDRSLSLQADQTSAKLIVQSFLVHNGVNVFGDLVCMPSTREQIVAEQGNQWIRDRGPSSHS